MKMVENWEFKPAVDAGKQANIGNLTSDLLTWSVENLSAFCFRTMGRNRIIRLKPSAREQRVCFIKHLAKGPKGSRPMWRAERG